MRNVHFLCPWTPRFWNRKQDLPCSQSSVTPISAHLRGKASYLETATAAYSKNCITTIGKCLLLHQLTFNTLREKCSTRYVTEAAISEAAPTPIDIQYYNLDTRDNYYHALRILSGIVPPDSSQALIEYFKDPHHFEGDDFDGILTPLLNQIVQILNLPNNILGIEYCKALLRLDSSIRPVTLKRQGMGYHETFPDQQTASSSLNFASASAIRNALKSGFGTNEILGELPDNAALVLETAVNKNEFLLEDDFSLLLQYCLLNETPESLISYTDMSKDLAARICNQINHFENFTQFTELLKTKELTYTRIQRALLHTILKIREQPKGIPYARVLGFRKSSSPLLKEIKQHTTIPVITKAADASGILSADGQKIWNDNLRASNIYESILAQKTGRPFVHEYQKQLILL